MGFIEKISDASVRAYFKNKYGGGGTGGGGSTGGEDWIGDGNTHIWISLQEGRTSPVLGICVNGAVTVDWGDGSEPDTITGTSTSTVKYTSAHDYSEPGDYIITLSGGEIGILGNSNYMSLLLSHDGKPANSASYAYRNAVKRVELSDCVTSIGKGSLGNCYSLNSVSLPSSITSVGDYLFYNCYTLKSVSIPSSITSIVESLFYNCYSLESVSIPSSVTSIRSRVFNNCYTLKSVSIPPSVTSVGDSLFSSCCSLTSIVIPPSVTSIGSKAFYYCYSVRFFDFTAHTSVPALASTNSFSMIPSDCEIRVPAALVDEWKAATNWSTYADYIVGV